MLVFGCSLDSSIYTQHNAMGVVLLLCDVCVHCVCVRNVVESLSTSMTEPVVSTNKMGSVC